MLRWWSRATLFCSLEVFTDLAFDWLIILLSDLEFLHRGWAWPPCTVRQPVCSVWSDSTSTYQSIILMKNTYLIISVHQCIMYMYGSCSRWQLWIFMFYSLNSMQFPLLFVLDQLNCIEWLMIMSSQMIQNELAKARPTNVSNILLVTYILKRIITYRIPTVH